MRQGQWSEDKVKAMPVKFSSSLKEDLPGGDLCDVTGVQDATGGEGVGGEGGALTLHWIFD